MFDVIQLAVQSNQVPEIKLVGTDAKWWWGGSFHRIAGAGDDPATGQVFYADPNETVKGTNWGHPFSDIDPLPVGPANYGNFTVAADGETIAGGTTVSGTTDFYKGAEIAEIDIVTIVPEPSTWLLLGSGLVGWSYGGSGQPSAAAFSTISSAIAAPTQFCYVSVVGLLLLPGFSLM